MKIKFQDKIYTIMPAVTNNSCKGCVFVSWNMGLCTAPDAIYIGCQNFNTIFQYSNIQLDIFDL